MAGFDFEFNSKSDEETLQRQILRRMQAASRDLGLELRYRKQPGSFHVSLNGPLPAMQSLPIYCYSELEAIAGAASAPPNRQRRRRMLARLLDAFEERLGEMAEGINELVHMFEAAGWTVVPRSLSFDSGSKSHLEPSLHAFRLALIQSLIGHITSRSLLEECHTTIEHLMNALLSAAERGSLSFEQKVDELVNRGAFDLPVENQQAAGGDLPARLKELKNRRRDGKHRALNVDSETADRLATAATNGAHVLLGAIRKRDQATH